MAVSAKKYLENAKDVDWRAVRYLKEGRDALVRRDYQAAMRNYKKCYKMNITKEVAAELLRQMANCMDQLEYYDQQQTYLEELCELELSFANVERLMKIYIATNNEVKRKAFAEKLKTLNADGEEEEKLAITLLAQAGDREEVLKRSLEWLSARPGDVEMTKRVINTYIEADNIAEAHTFAGNAIKEGLEDKLLPELSSLRKKEFDFEGARDYLLRHFKLHQENEYGVNLLAQTLMSDACYHGTLSDEDYVYWARRACEGTKPRSFENKIFDVNTDYFRRIRIGFVSYDFRMHSVGKFIMSLFDVINNNTGIETYCYYTYPDHEDDFTEVIKERADVFRSVGRYSNRQLRKVLLEDNLDILIDLNGQTVGNKLALLAERFAPVQITWMGFPFSSFHYNIDYIIGDYFFDPEDGETEKFCTEKILRMDPCYMCFAIEAENLDIDPEPPQVRNGYITFGMMNNPNKYSEESIRIWQKCLEAVPDSRLLIQLSKFGEGYLQDKLKERFERFGLDLSRVDFGTDYGQAGYYRTYNKCDVMLDSLPFGGGTTTPEALWMGVPVIGCQYHMRHGRMAYSFMTNAGLGGLCAESVEAYPEKVKEVAENAGLLRELRQNLRGRLKDTPLFQTKVFRTAFENAMRDIFVDYCMDNKWPFDPSAYGENDGTLLRDCVRAADIVTCEMTRERGADGERLEALLREYRKINAALMERLLVIYENDVGALALAAKAAEMLELLEVSDGADIQLALIKSIRSVLVKFA